MCPVARFPCSPAPQTRSAQTFGAHVTSPIQLARESSAPVACSSLENTRRAVARVLGFAGNVLGCRQPPALAKLKDGTLLASYTSFALNVRRKLPTSVATELADLQRVLSYLSATAPAHERAGLSTLQSTLRRLCRQLLAMPRREPPTVEDLTSAGQFCSLDKLWAFCDATFDSVDFDDRTRLGARRVHDTLMLFLCLREHCVKRPSCMWEVRVPGASIQCTHAGCSKPGCRGNAWRAGGGAPVLDIVHYKTERSSGGKCTIKVQAGSKTARLLAAHTEWGRALLLARGQDQNSSLWVTQTGRAFSSGKRFAMYLPALLKPCVKVTWTALRHIVAVSLVPIATQEEIEGLAAAMQTSARRARAVVCRDSDSAPRRAKAEERVPVESQGGEG